MSVCPRCGKISFTKLHDDLSGFQAWACSLCGYYKSDSPAYALQPTLFRNIGKRAVQDELLRAGQLPNYGLTINESDAWSKHEPDFTKRIVTPLNPKRRGNRACSLVLLPCRLAIGPAKFRLVTPLPRVG